MQQRWQFNLEKFYNEIIKGTLLLHEELRMFQNLWKSGVAGKNLKNVMLFEKRPAGNYLFKVETLEQGVKYVQS